MVLLFFVISSLYTLFGVFLSPGHEARILFGHRQTEALPDTFGFAQLSLLHRPTEKRNGHPIRVLSEHDD
jgi:hypothetical protein